MKLPPLIAETAARQVGIREHPMNSNCGPEVNAFKAATNLPPTEPWPWCAAFVDWVVRAAMEHEGFKETATFKRPKTAGAWDLINWALAQDNTVRTLRNPGKDIQAGDIIVYNFSHCGIAVGEPNKTGYFVAVEGNTDEAGSREGGGVYRKLRSASLVRARLRFTI